MAGTGTGTFVPPVAEPGQFTGALEVEEASHREDEAGAEEEGPQEEGGCHLGAPCRQGRQVSPPCTPWAEQPGGGSPQAGRCAAPNPQHRGRGRAALPAAAAPLARPGGRGWAVWADPTLSPGAQEAGPRGHGPPNPAPSRLPAAAPPGVAGRTDARQPAQEARALVWGSVCSPSEPHTPEEPWGRAGGPAPPSLENHLPGSPWTKGWACQEGGRGGGPRL